MGARIPALILVVSLVGILTWSCRIDTSLPDDTGTSPRESAWGSPYGDLTNRGLSKWTGPDTGGLAWTFDIGGKAQLQALAGVDGRVHVAYGSVLVAYDRTGNGLWRYQAGSWISHMQVLADGKIGLATLAGSLVLLDLDGAVDAKVDTYNNRILHVAFDDRGTVFYGDDAYHAINLHDGTERWQLPGQGSYSLTYPITVVGHRVFIDQDPYTVLNSDGSLSWSIENDERYSYEYMVDPKGRVYEIARALHPHYFEIGDTVRIFSSIGQVLLEKQFDQRIPYSGHPRGSTYLVSENAVGIYYPLAGNLMLTTTEGKDYYAILGFSSILGQGDDGRIFATTSGEEGKSIGFRAGYGWVVQDLGYEVTSDWLIDVCLEGRQIITGHVEYPDVTYSGVTVLDRNGRLSWTRPSHHDRHLNLLCADDGTLIIGDKYAINPPLQADDMVPLQDYDYKNLLGKKQYRFAVENDQLHAYDSLDHHLHTYAADEPIYSTPTADTKGTAYIIDRGNTLYSVGIDGTENWRVTVKGEYTWNIVVDGENLVLVRSMGFLQAFDSTGSLLWEFEPQNGYLYPPAVSHDGLIVIPECAGIPYPSIPDSAQLPEPRSASQEDGRSPNAIHALEHDGSLAWRIELDEGFDKQPIIDSRGRIYLCPSVMQYSSEVICLDSSGDEVWREDIKDHVVDIDVVLKDWCPTPDGKLCFRFDNRIVAIGESK